MASEQPISTGSPEVAGDYKEPIHGAEPAGEPEIPPPRPSGWMYRERKIGPITFPWYASPRTQLVMVAFVCFLCPGMFNALGGLGGGGKTDATLADNMVRPTTRAQNRTFPPFPLAFNSPESEVTRAQC
jgi:hypothetical protein